MNKKPYTLIYNDRWQSGSHHNCLTKMVRVIGCPKDILARYDEPIFLFEGHSKMEGENGINESEIIEC